MRAPSDGYRRIRPAGRDSATAGPPRLLGGRYELRSVIARGGMGLVWRGRDTRLGRDVAIKVLHSELIDDVAFLSRFRTEARHAALLSDPNIAVLYDYGEGPDGNGGQDVAYLVMELVDGEPVSELLRRAPAGLGVARTLDIVHQTAAALAAAHAAGVVHRDVKPANVVVTSTGAVKLTDFGIARSAAGPHLTATGEVLGTPHYLSPEQVEGQKATATSDVYSLGVVAYECLVGRRPFEGENSVETALRHVREAPPALPQDVPEDVRWLVERAMARNPAERFPDGAALRDAVVALSPGPLTGTFQQPTVQISAEGPRRRPSRRVARSAAAAGLFLLLVGAAVVAGRSLGSPVPAGHAVAFPTSGATSAPAPAPPVHVAEAELVGLQVADVQARLTALGLQVAVRTTETATVPAGAVVGVDPVGDVLQGQWVTVTYAVAPAATPSAVPATEATAPAPAPAPARPTQDRTERRHAPGNHHGKKG